MGFNVVTANDCEDRRRSIAGLKEDGYEVVVMSKVGRTSNNTFFKRFEECRYKYSGTNNKPKRVIFIPENEKLIRFLRSKGVMVIKYYPKYIKEETTQ